MQGGLPPENFHFSNPIPKDPEAIAGMEMILARRAHFILPNGRLDHERWAQTDMAWLSNRR